MTPSRTRTSQAKSDVGRLRGPLNGLIAARMKSQEIATVKEFADKYGIGRSTIYDLVRGRSDGSMSSPSLETIERLAEALEKPAHEIFYMVSPNARGAQAGVPLKAAQVPVYLAGHVGAGPEQVYELNQEVFVEADFAKGRNLVAFKVAGNSMAGGKRPIYDGDIVFVDQNLEGEVNAPVVAKLVGNGYVVKRLRPGGVLDSANPDYIDPEGSLIPTERIAQLVGRVVRVQANVI